MEIHEGPDSRECRNCHAIASMDTEKKSKSARRKHDAERLKASGKNCIDCHTGIAHEMPKDYEEPEEKEANTEAGSG